MSEDSQAVVGGGLKVCLYRIRLVGVAPFRSAREVVADRELILVEVVDAEGHFGWGECSAMAKPGYVPEYLDGCWALLRDVLVPDVVADPIGAMERLSVLPGHQMARSALIGALVDLELRGAGRSLAAALADGASTTDHQVPSNAVIGVQATNGELEAAVAQALKAGHRSVKLKITPPTGLGAVRVVRSAWPDLGLALDANGSYPDATAAIEGLLPIEQAAGTLAYVEQPVDADDVVGAAVVARRLATPVALDESVLSVGDAVTAMSLGAASVLNVKPARVGGPLEAMAIARIAASEGIGVFCGGMLESGVGRAAALAFAAQPECTLPCDLGPSDRYHRVDVTPPFVLTDGMLEVPDGPGIGVVPNPDVLQDLLVERWESG